MTDITHPEEEFVMPTPDETIAGLLPMLKMMRAMNADCMSVNIGDISCIMADGEKAVAVRAFLEAYDRIQEGELEEEDSVDLTFDEDDDE